MLVALPDSAEHIALLLALASIGAVSYCIDPRLSAAECQKEAAGLGITGAIVVSDSAGFADYPTYSLASLFEGFAGVGAAAGVARA